MNIRKIRFISAVSKNVICSINNPRTECTQLLVPSNGFVVLNDERYHVEQIINKINTHGLSYVTQYDSIDLDVDIYVKRITDNTVWLGQN
jgi:hypothetical protein